jgi:hypothetical protein
MSLAISALELIRHEATSLLHWEAYLVNYEPNFKLLLLNFKWW